MGWRDYAIFWLNVTPRMDCIDYIMLHCSKLSAYYDMKPSIRATEIENRNDAIPRKLSSHRKPTGKANLFTGFGFFAKFER